MAKFQSPLLGFNNNVRHRGRVFHIQTEDSGVSHPHIITHLFMDGGRILKSVKTSYAEHVGTDAMNETVRVLMKEQHKAMFIALRDGQFDQLVDPGKAPATRSPTAVVVPPAQRTELPSPEPQASAAPPEPPTERTAEWAARAPIRRSSQELTLDFDALGHDDGHSASPAPAPARPMVSPALGNPSPPAPRPSARYAPARPAAIFGAAPKRTPVDSPRSMVPDGGMFGDDLVHDKSLDEVILSYLAEDLGPPRRK
jgi:hypothetical protein